MLCRLFYIVSFVGIVILTVNWSEQASAQEINAGIFFDGSGSMKGFLNTRSIQNINSQLHDILSGLHFNPTSKVFVTSPARTVMRSLDEFIQNPVWGKHTRLDQAFSMSHEEQVLMIVTDNVQDAGEYGCSSTRNFYQLLEQNSVDTVVLCPLHKKFSGPLYFYKNRHPDLQELLKNLRKENQNASFEESNYKSKKYQVINMEGNRALAIYIIFRASFPQEVPLAFINRVKQTFGLEPLMVRPVDQGKFSIEGVNKKSEVKASFAAIKRICSIPGNDEFPIKPPNLSLNPPRSNILGPSSNGNKECFQVIPFRHKPYRANQSMLFRFYFKLINRSSTILLGKPGEQCSNKVAITLCDVKYHLPPSLMDCFVPSEKKLAANVIPGFIPNIIPNATVLNSGEYFPFVTGSVIKIPPFQVLMNLKALLKLAFTQSIPLQIKGSIKITVAPGYFSIDKAYEEQYFTRSVFDQGRIYTPEDIISYINISPTHLRFDFASQGLAVFTPLWLKIVLYATVAALLAGIIFLCISCFRHYYLRFDDTGEALFIYLPRPFSKGSYLRDNKEMLIIKRGLLNYLASPNIGYHLSGDENKPVPYIKLPSKEGFRIIGPGIGEVFIESISYSAFSDSANNISLSRKKTEKRSRPKKKEKGKEELKEPSVLNEADRLFGPDE